MWIAPKDDGFMPWFERSYAYGIWGNLEIVEAFQQKSDSERMSYENKLREDNPDRYEMFKHWCRHHGYLKDFYHYEIQFMFHLKVKNGKNWLKKLIKQKAMKKK